MVEARDNLVRNVKGNEIVLMIVTSLFPYGLEGSDPMIFHMFFGHIFYFDWFPELHFRMIFDFFPGWNIDIIIDYLYVWSVVVIIPLLLNILLILFSFRNRQSRSPIHIVGYLAIGGLAYSVGLSMMSGILSLPFTPIAFMILQMIRHFTNGKTIQNRR
jgi:hypothetical protein